jgi:DHA2 family multidrug resistance protein
MVGPILGPTLGGWLTEVYDWRWVFYINVPIGILTFVGLSAYLSETQTRKGSFDWFGFAMLSIAIGSFQMMLDRGEQLDWFSSTEIVIEAVVAGLAFYLFLVQTFTAKAPFIDPHIFKDRNFTIGLCFIFVVGIILLASLALITPYLQNLMGYPVLTAGLVLAPRGMGTMVAMMVVGRIINRVDARVLLAAGLLLTAEVLWEMTYFTPDVSQWTLIRTGVLQGMGLGFMFVPLSTITFSTLSGVFRTQGTALYSLMRNIGSSIGISLVIFLLTRNTQIVHSELVGHITPFNDALGALGPAQFWNRATTVGLAALDAEVTKQASVVAYADDFKLMMLVALVALPLIFLLKRARAHAGEAAILE